MELDLERDPEAVTFPARGGALGPTWARELDLLKVVGLLLAVEAPWPGDISASSAIELNRKTFCCISC